MHTAKILKILFTAKWDLAPVLQPAICELAYFARYSSFVRCRYASHRLFDSRYIARNYSEVLPPTRAMPLVGLPEVATPYTPHIRLYTKYLSLTCFGRALVFSIALAVHSHLTLDVHAQRGLQYLVCRSVRLALFLKWLKVPRSGNQANMLISTGLPVDVEGTRSRKSNVYLSTTEVSPCQTLRELLAGDQLAVPHK